MVEAIIQLVCAGKVYHTGGEQLTALADICLTIEPGERVAVIGPSGCGKSTLLHVIGCLENLTTGTYLFNGVDIAGCVEFERARLRLETFGFVFQRFCLIEELTVFENVELPLLYRGIAPAVRRERTDRALADVGLLDRKHERPGNLSGGQQQRVAIARAMVGLPRVILADEPTGNLDAASSATVTDLLLRSQQSMPGSILIVVTHNRELAERMDRVIELAHGRIALDREAAAMTLDGSLC